MQIKINIQNAVIIEDVVLYVLFTLKDHNSDPVESFLKDKRIIVFQ